MNVFASGGKGKVYPRTSVILMGIFHLVNDKHNANNFSQGASAISGLGKVCFGHFVLGTKAVPCHIL